MKRLITLILCVCLIAGCAKKSAADETDELRLYSHCHYGYRIPYTWSERQDDDNDNVWNYYTDSGLLTLTFYQDTRYDYTKKLPQQQLINETNFEHEDYYVKVDEQAKTFAYDAIKGFKTTAKVRILNDQYKAYFAGTTIGDDNITLMLMYSDKKINYSDLLDTIIQSIHPSTDEEEEQANDEETADDESDTNTDGSDDSVTDDQLEEDTSEKRSDIDPTFKKKMDDYEAFIDEYFDFMTSYDKAEDTTKLMTKYLSYLSRFEESSRVLDDIDTYSLTEEEQAYYMSVMARIMKKLMSLSD